MDKQSVMCVCVCMRTHNHVIEYYSAVRRREVLVHGAAQMDLETCSLKEACQEDFMFYDSLYVKGSE